MIKKQKKINLFGKLVIIIGIVIALWYLLSLRTLPTKISYGVSFSKFHSDELDLDWGKTYLAVLDELKVKRLRLSAHWPMVEPIEGKYNFSELDYQLREAKKRDVAVILAVGRRLPGWPECHEPTWTREFTESEKRQKILGLIETIVKRYRNNHNLKYWQVENEPFLGFFGRSHCQGSDEKFLKQEIGLVHDLDPGHPVIITDSGEFGNWYRAYRNTDVFGSSMYLYVWSRALGPIRYPIGPSFFRSKLNLIDFVYGVKPKVLIELSAEPWLLKPIVETPIELQLQRMDIGKFNEVINFARRSGFETQYLWGAEWWYWMKQRGHPEFWQKAIEIINAK